MRKNHFALIIFAYVSFWCSVDYVWSATQDTLFSTKVSQSPLSGGETTVDDTSRDAFAKPLKNLPTELLRDFTFGNKMFNTKWVTAPASVTSLDGLGPTFNRRSCAACHFKDGRGEPPRSLDEPMKSMLIRLSIPGKTENGGPVAHPNYDLQLNDSAIHGVTPEGNVTITYEKITGEYADGTSYTLQKPIYTFNNLAFGELGDTAMFSPRVSPAVFGMGLLDSIPDEVILNLADPDDKDNDGISGRPNMVWDDIENEEMIGRYGWKANTASIEQQDADAAFGDIGLTNRIHPKENCPPAQKQCQQAVQGEQPDISDMQLDRLTFYISNLAPPARRNVDDPRVIMGAKLFERAQCASCHIPQIKTDSHAIYEELANQNIQPFTDLLLHDMGDALGDGRPDFLATGNEWRTPPLWGIGLVSTVNQHTNFLHDGRARNLEEAILWHGGEAEASKEKFKAMNKDERKALIQFLNSL